MPGARDTQHTSPSCHPAGSAGFPQGFPHHSGGGSIPPTSALLPPPLNPSRPLHPPRPSSPLPVHPPCGCRRPPPALSARGRRREERMGVEGPRCVGGGVSSCRGPIGLQPWLPTTGMPGPHPLACWGWGGGSGGPQMLTSGAANPSLGSRAPGCCPLYPMPPPAEAGAGGQALGSALSPPPIACPPSAWRVGGVWAGPVSPEGSHLPLWTPILASPSPGRARRQLRSGGGGSQRGMAPRMAL